MRRPLVFAFLAIPVALAVRPASSAAQLPLTAGQILTQFNAVVSGTFRTRHDVEGRLVAGDIQNQNSATFYNKPHPSSAASSFRAVNALKVTSCPSCNVNNGGSVNTPAGMNAGTFNYNAGNGQPQGASVTTPAFTMDAFTSPLNDLSAGIRALGTNSTVNASDPNQFRFMLSPDAQGRAVVRVQASQLAAANNILFGGNLVGSTTIIIDVLGTSFTQGQNSNFNADESLQRRLIWNFADATSVSVKTWHGAMLAGQATVSNSSPINGMLYARNFDGTIPGGELHDRPFTGSVQGISTVPEPATVGLVGAGLAVLAGATRRRRR